MIIKEYINTTYSANTYLNGFEPQEILFLDIETTGFSRKYSHATVIGILGVFNESIKTIQLFIEGTADEANALVALKEHFGHKKLLITYNGDSFDIPYLKARCEFHQISSDFLEIPSLDLYLCAKEIFKRDKQLKSFKLKDVESFLGIYREDAVSGAQVVELYKNYITTHSNEAKDLILLHNREDIENLPPLIEILKYPINQNQIILPIRFDEIILERALFQKSYLNIECFISNETGSLSPYMSTFCIIKCYGSFSRASLNIPIERIGEAIIVDTMALFNKALGEFDAEATHFILCVDQNLHLDHLKQLIKNMIKKTTLL